MGQNALPHRSGTAGGPTVLRPAWLLITRNLLFRLEQAPAGAIIRRFYIGRAVRLVPACYLTLLVLFVLGVPEVRDFILWIAFGSSISAMIGALSSTDH
ncbi:hypothetical protein NKJ36_29180 [Mesorhizobium sp. M0142]|uniref:hypothetical protein n=1 Tax=Mesorhizobium sp. M0142 TaxID=2956894 RepID=UPI003336BB35